MKTSSEVEALVSSDGMEAMVKGWASKAERGETSTASISRETFVQFGEEEEEKDERKADTVGHTRYAC